MRFLAINEVWEWCQNHGFKLGDDHSLLPDPALVHRGRETYGESGRTGRESAVAARCIEALPPWQECLLWVVLWGVWPSSEDWPSYYAKRGERGERRSLHAAPGHLFTQSDLDAFREILTLVFENAWEAHVLPVTGQPDSTRAFASHDGWVEVQSTQPVSFGVVAA